MQGPVQVLQNLGKRNKEHTNCRHSAFQAQIHNNSSTSTMRQTQTKHQGKEHWTTTTTCWCHQLYSNYLKRQFDRPKKKYWLHEQWSNEGASAGSHTGNVKLTCNIRGRYTHQGAQKINASTTISPVVVSPPTLAFVELPQPHPWPLPKFIMQENDLTPTSYNHLADNTHAKMLKRSFTQDFVQHVLEKEVRTSQVQGRGTKFKITWAILDDKTGSNTQSTNKHGVIPTAMNWAG